MEIPYKKIKQSIELPNGERIVLYHADSANREMPLDDMVRNVFKLTIEGTPKWRIQALNPKDVGAFLEVYLSADGRLRVYNADSWEYEVDVETGMARPYGFLK